jgi:dihydrolipoamide dehydrogenase
MMLGSKVVEIKEKKNGSLSVKIDSGTKSDIFDYEKILIAIGRTPNSKHLNLEATNVDINERGFIRVDEYQRTSVATIFAIGDVSDNPMLAHKATHQGKVAAEVACGEPAIFDPKAIPSVVYTDPEVAWCGLTEVQAKEEDIPYSKSEFPWAASGRAIAVGANQGKTKILFDEESKTVLGVGIVGPSAGDIISEGMLAIEMGSDVEDISLTVHPHPTLGETFALAAEVFDGTITDLYIPKK